MYLYVIACTGVLYLWFSPAVKIPRTAVPSGLGSGYFHEVFSVVMTFETNVMILDSFVGYLYVLMLWVGTEFKP